MVKSFADPSAHVVSEIMYGANSLLVLEEPIGIGETKESAEDRLFYCRQMHSGRLSRYFRFIGSRQCRFYSDLPGENPLIGCLSECFSKVEEILNKMQRLISIFR